MSDYEKLELAVLKRSLRDYAKELSTIVEAKNGEIISVKRIIEYLEYVGKEQ